MLIDLVLHMRPGGVKVCSRTSKVRDPVGMAISRQNYRVVYLVISNMVQKTVCFVPVPCILDHNGHISRKLRKK